MSVRVFHRGRELHAGDWSKPVRAQFGALEPGLPHLHGTLVQSRCEHCSSRGFQVWVARCGDCGTDTVLTLFWACDDCGGADFVLDQLEEHTAREHPVARRSAAG